jgi:hypothetical protein
MAEDTKKVEDKCYLVEVKGVFVRRVVVKSPSEEAAYMYGVRCRSFQAGEDQRQGMTVLVVTDDVPGAVAIDDTGEVVEVEQPPVEAPAKPAKLKRIPVTPPDKA